MKPITFFLLGILFISMASAYTFCEDGSRGAIKIVSLKDKLDDNYKSLEWGDEQDIRLSFEVENNLNTTQDFTMEIMFLDKSGEEVYPARGKLIETQRIRGNDNDKIGFDFEIKGNQPHSKYDMFTKLYVTENESKYCVQKEHKIIINSFDSCEDTTDLVINSIENPSNFSWKLDSEIKIDVEVSSSMSSDDYEIELVFYDKYNSEQTIAQDSFDLIETETIDNETMTIEFNFQIEEKLDIEKYGLYVKVTSDDGDCAEKRIFKNYRKGKSTLREYMQIKIKDTPGIIVTSVVGPTTIISGTQVTYQISLTNTGDTEPQVKVFAYNSPLGIKATKVIMDFKKDTKRTINITFLAGGAPTKTTLGFFADYDYVNDSGYFESSTSYNHDVEHRIEIVAPVITKPKPTPPKTNEPIVKNTLTPIKTQVGPASESTNPYALAIAILLILLILVVGIKLYRKYSEPSVSQGFD